jgi:hypothetical protein
MTDTPATNRRPATNCTMSASEFASYAIRNSDSAPV